jgi:hypothetical protein
MISISFRFNLQDQRLNLSQIYSFKFFLININNLGGVKIGSCIYQTRSEIILNYFCFSLQCIEPNFKQLLLQIFPAN